MRESFLRTWRRVQTVRAAVRPYYAVLLLAALAASGATFVACGGGDHTFSDGDGTDTSVDDTNVEDGTKSDTHKDTTDDTTDDVPSSSH